MYAGMTPKICVKSAGFIFDETYMQWFLCHYNFRNGIHNVITVNKITINGGFSLYVPVQSKFEAAISIMRAI